MERFYQFIKKNLSLTYSEARGFTTLLIICLSVLILYLIPEIFTKVNNDSNQRDIRQLDSLVALLEKPEISQEAQELFFFDPNNISLDSLLLLGFPRKTAERYMNYLATGAKFYKKEDLKKIYGLPDSLMNRIYPFIDLQDNNQTISSNRESVVFDLNKVSPERLKEIKMIGDVTAGRIVAYRNLLGGFMDKNQLSEVYGLEDEALTNLIAESYINPKFRPKLIQINHADEAALRAHPYISNQLAEDIILYREINGSIKSETVLAGFKSVDKSNFDLLILYLDFQF